MSERFYGPWRVELAAPVINAVGFRQARVDITGYGTYDLPTDPDTTFVIDVDGEAWDLEVAIFNSHAGYQTFETRRTTNFDRVDGLTAIVEVGHAPTSQHQFSLFYVKLRCVSTDPTIQPDPADLYDFTLPLG